MHSSIGGSLRRLRIPGLVPASVTSSLPVNGTRLAGAHAPVSTDARDFTAAGVRRYPAVGSSCLSAQATPCQHLGAFFADRFFSNRHWTSPPCETANALSGPRAADLSRVCPLVRASWEVTVSLQTFDSQRPPPEPHSMPLTSDSMPLTSVDAPLITKSGGHSGTTTAPLARVSRPGTQVFVSLTRRWCPGGPSLPVTRC